MCCGVAACEIIYHVGFLVMIERFHCSYLQFTPLHSHYPGLCVVIASQRALSILDSRSTPIPTYYASLKKWLPIMQVGQQAVGYSQLEVIDGQLVGDKLSIIWASAYV